MIYKKRPLNIASTDKVLEVGPGGSPHGRSDVFLEMEFSDEREAACQRSFCPELKTEKKIVYYDGNKFPFEDNEFDYVICSHVIEHVPNLELFFSELMRVSSKGYLEFPTIYYDYLYNFPTHLNLLYNKNNMLYCITKEQSGLNNFCPVNVFFNRTLELRYTSILKELKEYFFQGFEWSQEIKFKKVSDIGEVALSIEEMSLGQNSMKNKNKIVKELERILNRFRKIKF